MISKHENSREFKLKLNKQLDKVHFDIFDIKIIQIVYLSAFQCDVQSKNQLIDEQFEIDVKFTLLTDSIPSLISRQCSHCLDEVGAKVQF